jgi:DNA-binding transcriptional MocR family regulator
MNKKELLYIQIANNIEYQIRNAVFKVGDKLPSLRTICIEKGVSLSTATQAFFELESRGLVESRPQSGYYVSLAPEKLRAIPETSQPIVVKSESKHDEMMSLVIKNFDQAQITLSSAMLSPELVPIAKLNKSIVNATRSLKDSGVSYSKDGSIKLKTQIAKRAITWGGKLQVNDIITTGGSIDSMSFCLLALTKRGDTILVESPVFFGILRLAGSLGLNIVELPTNPITGIEVDALKKTLEKKKVALCLLVSNFSNPLGSCMPDEHKKAVVKLMEKYNIPLVEDDLYADLYYGSHRPSSCKTYDESGVVLWCGSFSKTLVSGYRVGWVAPGKFKEQVARTKQFHSMYSSTITHEAVGDFLEIGRYEHHLIKLRRILYRNSLQLQRCISEYFPEDTKVTRPLGSMNLWIELNKKYDTLDLYNKAIAKKISITPGRIYTMQNQYNNCLKLSYGKLWDDQTEAAIKLLGKLTRQL